MVIAESVNGGLFIIFGEALLADIAPGLGPGQVLIDLAAGLVPSPALLVPVGLAGASPGLLFQPLPFQPRAPEIVHHPCPPAPYPAPDRDDHSMLLAGWSPRCFDDESSRKEFAMTMTLRHYAITE